MGGLEEEIHSVHFRPFQAITGERQFQNASIYIVASCMMFHFLEFEDRYHHVELGDQPRRSPGIVNRGYSESRYAMYSHMKPFTSQLSDYDLGLEHVEEVYTDNTKVYLPWLMHAIVYWEHNLRYNHEDSNSFGRVYKHLSPSQKIQCWKIPLSPISDAVEIGTDFLGSSSGAAPSMLEQDELYHGMWDIFGADARSLPILRYTFKSSRVSGSMHWPMAFESIIPVLRDLYFEHARYVEITGDPSAQNETWPRFEALGWLMPVPGSHLHGWQRLVFVKFCRTAAGDIDFGAMLCGYEAIVLPGGKLLFGRYVRPWVMGVAAQSGPFMMWNVD